MSENPALFPALLGARWESLPPCVRAMHGGHSLVRARGRVTVEGDPGWTARALRALFRLLGLTLPLRWFGGVTARCGEQDGHYRFAATAHLPLVGLLVAYSGWLGPVDAD